MMRPPELAAEIWKKTDRYYQRQKVAKKRQWDGPNERFLVVLVSISREPLQSKPILSNSLNLVYLILLHAITKCPIDSPVTLKRLTVNNHEMSFYAKICFIVGLTTFFPCFRRQPRENEWWCSHTVSNKNVRLVSGDIRLVWTFPIGSGARRPVSSNSVESGQFPMAYLPNR